jgi:hypothetical protein
VANVLVEPINKANDSYIKWVKAQTASGKGFKYSDDLDEPENSEGLQTEDSNKPQSDVDDV